MVSPSTLGRLALGDASFVTRLEQGRQPKEATAYRLLDYIIDDLEMPIPGDPEWRVYHLDYAADARELRADLASPTFLTRPSRAAVRAIAQVEARKAARHEIPIPTVVLLVPVAAVRDRIAVREYA